MLRLLSRYFAVVGFTALGACAVMPELPPDWAMPEREIVHHSACEVQSALRYLATLPYPKSVFVPTDWTVKISLNPKIDADISAGAGLTSKSPGVSTATRFVTWVAGGPAGATAESKGERTGNLDFVFDAKKLMADDGLDCAHEPFALHSLTKKIGIGDWLVRSVEAAARTNSTIDKPSFSSDVFMKFSGSGSYTYTFPAGTNLYNLGGFYSLQETLNVNLTAKPETKQVVATTLPPGGAGFNTNDGRAVTSSVRTLQDTRSDLQQIEQAIRNNKLNTQ